MKLAYEHNGQPVLREAFYAIACDPRRSVAVQACAGAGKTWMLVSRILRALLDGAEPHEILAITFTKKAAGEMRARLSEWLLDFARPRQLPGGAAETPAQWDARLDQELLARGIEPQRLPDARERLRQLYPALLAYGRQVQIRTFHSWFAALLRNAPLAVLQQLGLPPVYELLEDEDEAIALVWRPYLRRVADAAALAADYAALVAEAGRQRAHEALTSALKRRVEFALADAAGHVDEAVAAFDTCYPRMAGVAQPQDWLLARGSGRALLQAAAQALAPAAPSFAAKGAALQQALAAGDWPGVQDALLSKNGEPRKFSPKIAALHDVRAAQNEVLAVLAAQRQQQARQYHLRVARLTRPLLDEFAALKRQRGWVDMSDIERAALTLLSDPLLSGWVQERLDARVRHLLIDEFQDTNPLQWQALHEWLSAYAGAGGGQGAPTLFIVGDPKQSIYRFRRADPRVFAAAQDFVVQALGGERLACDHTRRNTPAVLAAVNAVMQQAQDAGQYSGFRPHTTESRASGHIGALPLIPRPGRASADDASEQAPPVWRDSLTQPRQQLEETLRTQECRQAAHWIASRIAAGHRPDSLMVLARKRLPLGVLQAELRQLGIACDQPEDQRLADQPAARDVLALVEALLSPGHDLALAQALKSPLFGLGDEDLTRIAHTVRAASAQGPRPCWLDALPHTRLSAPAAQDGPALHADLLRYRQWLLALPPHDALQAILHHRDALARFAAAAPAPERAHVIAHLRALLAAALQVQGGRHLTAYQWLQALRRQSPPAPRPPAQGAVALLTVHGAKGLEADQVLLLDAASAARPRSEPAVLMDWPGDARAPTRLAFLASESAPPPSLAELAQQEADAQAREELNALYVAMTRARQALVLSGFAPHRQSEGSWWQRIQPLAQPLPAPSAPSAAAVPDVALAPESAPASQPPACLLPELPQLPQLPGQPEPPASPASPALPEWPEWPAPASPPNAPPQPLPAHPAADASAPNQASLLGEAMHWLLEHASDSPSGWLPQRLAQARQRLGISAQQAEQAQHMARRILQGQAAWAWQPEHISAAFNEIELTHQGQRLRIDRLVRRRAQGNTPESWWVLDYKSAFHPERDAALTAQLRRYRSAVQTLHPGTPVQAAFLSGDGRMVTI